MKTFKQLQEVLKKSDDLGTWISDFVHSDNPKFAGKSKKERIDMAKGAYYAKQRNEAAEMKKDPCWKGYEMVGTKDKNGKAVPNCVPKEAVEQPQAPVKKDKSGLGKIADLMKKHKEKRPADWAQAMNAEEVNEAKEHTYHFFNGARDEYGAKHKKAAAAVGIKAKTSDSGKDIYLRHHDDKHVAAFVKKHLKGEHENSPHEMHDHKVHASHFDKLKETFIHPDHQKELDDPKTPKARKDYLNKLIHSKKDDNDDHEAWREKRQAALKGRHYHEEVEQIDELSKATLKSYADKAHADAKDKAMASYKAKSQKKADALKDKANKRTASVAKADLKAASMDESRAHKIIATKLANMERAKNFRVPTPQERKDMEKQKEVKSYKQFKEEIEQLTEYDYHKAVAAYPGQRERAEKLSDKANHGMMTSADEYKKNHEAAAKAHRKCMQAPINNDTHQYHFKAMLHHEKKANEGIKKKKSVKEEMEQLTEYEHQAKDSKITAKLVKQGIGIARDKRYAGGNMTGAVKAMDKLHPGLSSHKRVSDELWKQNEEFETEGVMSKQAHIDFKNMSGDEFKTKYGKSKSAYKQTAQTQVEEVELEEGLGNTKNNTQTIHKPTTDSMRVHSYVPPKKLATSPLKNRPASTAAKTVTTGITSTVHTKGKPVTQNSQGKPVTQNYEKKPVTKKDVNLGQQEEEVEKDANPNKGKHQQIKFLQKEQIDEFDTEDFKMKSFNEFNEEIEALVEASNDNEHLTKKHSNGKYDLLHKDSSMMSKIKKGMTDHEKKHMAGAYRDDTDIVHGKTDKTMTSIHGKTVGKVRKEIQKYIAKHHPPVEKPKAGHIKHVHDTRSIVTTGSDDHADHLKKTFHGKDAHVNIYQRKEGNKVYITSKTKEHHDKVKRQLNKIKHTLTKEEVEIDEFDMETFKMKSYKDFMEQLNEYTPDKSGRTIIKGRAYGGAAQYDDEHEAEFGRDYEDKEKYKERLFGKTAKKEKPAETPVKRGRGRPTGSNPGTYKRR